MPSAPPSTGSTPHRGTARPQVRIELTPKTFVVVLLMIAGVWMVVKLLPVLLALIAALMLVGALNPAVGWLESRRFRRKVAIGVVFTTSLALSLLLLFLTIP